MPARRPRSKALLSISDLQGSSDVTLERKKPEKPSPEALQRVRRDSFSMDFSSDNEAPSTVMRSPSVDLASVVNALIARGNYDEAIEVSESKLRSSFGPSRQMTITVLVQTLNRAALQCSNTARSFSLLSRALNICKDSADVSTTVISKLRGRTLLNRASVYMRKKPPDTRLAAKSAASAIRASEGASDPVLLAEAHINACVIHTEMKQFSVAVTHGRTAISILNSNPVANSTSPSSLSVPDLHVGRRQSVLMKSLLQQHMQASHEEDQKSHTIATALAMFNTGIALEHQGRIDQALTEYRGALGVARAGLGPSHEVFRRIDDHIGGIEAAREGPKRPVRKVKKVMKSKRRRIRPESARSLRETEAVYGKRVTRPHSSQGLRRERRVSFDDQNEIDMDLPFVPHLDLGGVGFECSPPKGSAETSRRRRRVPSSRRSHSSMGLRTSRTARSNVHEGSYRSSSQRMEERLIPGVYVRAPSYHQFDFYFQSRTRSKPEDVGIHAPKGIDNIHPDVVVGDAAPIVKEGSPIDLSKTLTIEELQAPKPEPISSPPASELGQTKCRPSIARHLQKSDIQRNEIYEQLIAERIASIQRMEASKLEEQAEQEKRLEKLLKVKEKALAASKKRELERQKELQEMKEDVNTLRRELNIVLGHMNPDMRVGATVKARMENVLKLLRSRSGVDPDDRLEDEIRLLAIDLGVGSGGTVASSSGNGTPHIHSPLDSPRVTSKVAGSALRRRLSLQVENGTLPPKLAIDLPSSPGRKRRQSTAAVLAETLRAWAKVHIPSANPSPQVSEPSSPRLSKFSDFGIDGEQTEPLSVGSDFDMGEESYIDGTRDSAMLPIQESISREASLSSLGASLSETTPI